MEGTEQHTCEARVHGYGGWSSHRCGKPAKDVRDGKHLCGVHRAAFDRKAANTAKYNESYDASARRKAEADDLIRRLREAGIVGGLRADYHSSRRPRDSGYTGGVVVAQNALEDLLARLEAREDPS